MSEEKEMREYVSRFCAMYSYPDGATDALLDAYDRIVGKHRDVFFSLVGEYEADIGCEKKRLLRQVEELANDVGVSVYTAQLLFLICLSEHLKWIYSERGLSDELWYGSMEDLKWKLFECRSVKGVWGIFVAEWCALFFELRIITLGRLQYEAADFGRYYEKDGIKLTPSSKVVMIHIPRTMTPLDEESCEESYRMAKEFFRDLTVGGKLPLACESWLLYAENEKLFSEGSNTKRFFRQFDILQSAEHKDGHPELWRLFDTDNISDLDKLPYDTSLRRAYVDHLRGGGNTGYGYGIFLY